jgi:hypothetical protein
VPKAKRGIGGANRVAVVVPIAVVAVVAVERTVTAVPVLAAVSVKAVLQLGSSGTNRRCRQAQQGE